MVRQKDIKVTLRAGESSVSVACVTVTNGHDGRQGRFWVRVYMKPNGQLHAILSTLGKTAASDSEKSSRVSWQNKGHFERNREAVDLEDEQ